MPDGYRGELIYFPLDFAASLPHQGREDLRFPAGFFDPASPAFWSYAFTWRTLDPAVLDARAVGDELTAYFRGLVAAVDEERAIEDRASIVVRATGAGPRFELAARVIDPFRTRQPVDLTGFAERRGCATGALWVFVLAPAASGVRAELDALAAQAGCTAIPSPADELVEAIERGDHAPALHALCAAYAARGLPCADTVRLTRLAPDDVMSKIDERWQIHMQPMARDGFAYWDNWSRIMTDGAWDHRALFTDEADARRVANMLLVTVLAHELGHHTAERFACHPYDSAERELRADELSVPIVVDLVRDPRLGPLHDRMRAVTDAMIATPLPRPIPTYVATHLARQRRLIADPPPDAVTTTCLPAWRERVTNRELAGAGEVVTRAVLPISDGEHVAIDRTGAVYATAMFPAGDQIVIHRLDDDRAPPRTVTIPGIVVQGLLAHGPDRLALHDGGDLWLLEGPALAPRKVTGGGVSVASYGFDAAGAVVLSQTDGASWTQGRWSLPHRTTTTRDWGDGRPGHGWPTRFVVEPDRVVFFDGSLDAIRALTPTGVVTLAGHLAGRRDGPAGEAQLSDVAALAIAPDGRILFVERSATDLAIREIRHR